MYMYIFVMVASESLKATGGGEAGFESLYASKVKKVCWDEESSPCVTIEHRAETDIPAKW